MDQSLPQSPTAPRTSSADEAVAFLVLAILIWPVLVIAFVGAYCFVVRISQLVLGLPGP